MRSVLGHVYPVCMKPLKDPLAPCSPDLPRVLYPPNIAALNQKCPYAYLINLHFWSAKALNVQALIFFLP
jgi:hypothetical protein